MPSKPPEGRRIKKGQRLNPEGCSAKMRTRAAIRRMTHDELADLTSLLFTSDRSKIAAIANDPKSSFVQILTAKLLADCYRKGDIGIYRALIEQTVGFAPRRHTHEVTGRDGGPVRVTEQTEKEMLEELHQLQMRRQQLDGQT